MKYVIHFFNLYTVYFIIFFQGVPIIIQRKYNFGFNPHFLFAYFEGIAKIIEAASIRKSGQLILSGLLFNDHCTHSEEPYWSTPPPS